LDFSNDRLGLGVKDGYLSCQEIRPTTADERLFERDLPDLFEWIVNQMGDLSTARMDRKSSSDNLLSLQSVPA
jgi:hypothetical protein